MALPTLDATFASSVDLPRRQMLARWLVEELGETQAPSSVLVSGLSDSQYNGLYVYDGEVNGFPSYILNTDNNINLYADTSGPEGPAWYLNEGATILFAFWSFSEEGNYPAAYPWIQYDDNSGVSIDTTGLAVTESPAPSPLSNYYSLPERYLWAKIAVAAGGPKTEADYISLPKNYAWSDIYNAVSGDIANSAVVVSGAGTSSSNGTYVKTGFSDGKPIYNFGLNTIAWSSADSYWYIFDDEVVGDVVYFSFDDTSYPWEATGWNIESGGASPAPTLTPKTPNHTDWSEKQALGHIAAAYRGDTGTPENLATYIDWPWRYQVAAIIDGFVVVLTATFVYQGATLVDSVFGAIPAGWQDSNTDIDQLVLGTSATSIGSQAFQYCTSLAGSLTIPNSVTSIGSNAFYYCYGFTGSLTIGNGVTSIGDYAFNSCFGFTGSLTLGSGLTSIGGYAFRNTSFTGSLTIPNSVTTIGNSAFNYCFGFTGSLTMSGATSIGSNAFYGASFNGLNVTGTSVSAYQFAGAGFVTGDLNIANTVTSIGIYAFSYYGGGSLTMSGTTTIGSGAFYYAGFNGLNVTGTSISAYQFNNAQNVSGSLNIANTITTIGSYAFNSLSNLTGSLTIPNSVTSISSYAFQGCSGFTSLSIGSGLTSINNGAFKSCSGFTGSLTISNSVTSIGNSAFQNCSGFTGSLTIPNSVTSIGVSAFQSCSGLTGTLTIPNSVTSIGVSAFQSCSGLTGNLTIPNSVTSIGASAFQSCSGLTGALTISNSVTSIGVSAFLSCSGLTGNLTIPNSVTSIGIDAFRSCSGLTGALTIPNSVTSIGASAFRSCSGLTTVLCYVTRTIINAASNALSNTGVTTIRARASDATWTAGAGQTVSGKTGITVIKDL